MTVVQCPVDVFDQGGWHCRHWGVCGRKAKYRVVRTEEARGSLLSYAEVGGVVSVCGIHKNQALRDGWRQIESRDAL